MVRPRLRAWSACALVAIACGPGDHEKNAGFGNLFGGGSAGKSAPAHEDDDTSDPPDDESADSSPTTRPTSIATAGRASSPATNNRAMSGASGSPQRPTSNGAAGTGPKPSNMGATGGEAAGGTAATPDAPDTTAPMSNCDAGYVEVAGQCVCDMNGTFAFHATSDVSMPSTPPLEALTDTADFWGIVIQQYDAQGNLEMSLSSCGQSSPDLCAAAKPPVLPSAEAYGQYVPVEVWEMPGTPAVAQMPLPEAVPGSAFITPTFAQLFGITLNNPLGAWPSSRKNVDGGGDFGGSATNGARWADIDGDGKLGMTVKVVAPGGVAAAASSGPPFRYEATSPKCPRSDAQAARSPYAYVPLPQGLGVKRIKALYSAERIRLEFHGALETCDRISGMLTGANAGKLKLDGVLGGCAIVNGEGESACSSSLLDSSESSGNANTSAGLVYGSTGFVLARIPDGTTCAEVRAMQLD